MSNPRIGRDQTVGIGRQTTRGTQVSPQYWLQKTAFEFNRAVEQVNDESALGVSADSDNVIVTKKSSAPTISAYVDISAIGLIEYGVSESYADTLASGTAYYHTMKGGIASTVERMLTIAVDDTNLEGDQYVKDYKINTITLNANTNSIVTVDLDGVGYYPTSGSYTSAFTTPTNFTGKHVTVKFASAVSGLAGATAVNLKGLTFTRTLNVNNDDSAFLLGDDDIGDHWVQQYQAELTLNKFLENQTYIDYMEAGTTYAMQITIQGDTAITGAYYPTIQYTFPKVSFMSSTGGDNNTLRTEDLTIKPHYGLDDSESASYLWKTIITNTVTDYEA